MDYEDPTLFDGIRFYLAGFDSISHSQVKSKIVSCGGVYMANYSQDCTHVIVYNLLLDDPICVAARRDGKALVTDLWITHSFEAGMLADTSSVMYQPAKELNGIPGANKLVISLTGFQGARRLDIMTLVGLMGAEFCKNLVPSKVTHLICYKFEGDKYVVGKKFSTIKIVNHQWLEDCLKAWKILPEEHYSKSSYELEMMEAMALDSEEETADIAARLPYQRGVMNGISSVQNESGIAHHDSVISSRVSTSSAQKTSINVRNDEMRLPFVPEQASESEVRHKIDKHTPVKQNNDEHNMMKMPLESDCALQDGRELGNPSRSSSKRSADSLVDYSGPSNSRKTVKRSNVSAQKSGSSNKKTMEYLKSEGKQQRLAEKVNVNVNGCDIEADKKLSSSEVVLPDGEGQRALPLSKQRSGHSEVSRVTPKLQKLKATASKRVDASEPTTLMSSPHKKSKNSSLGVSSLTGTGTVRASDDKSSMATEKLQVGESNHMSTRTSPTSGNGIACTTSDVNNKKAKPHNSSAFEFASFSPELRELEVSKSGSSKFKSDDQTGSSASKTPRKKMVARKTLGSRPKVSKTTADAKKGSLSGKFSNDDAASHLTSQIGGKDHAIPSVADKITSAHTVDGPNTLKCKPLLDVVDDIDDYAAPFNDDAEALPEFAVHQNDATESSHVTKARARATSGMLNCETDEAELTNLLSANTYKQRMEHAKQNLSHKTENSGKTNEKTVISAPKEMIQIADDNACGKASEKKESVKIQTVPAAGKKRRGRPLVKKIVQAENEPVGSDDPGACDGDKCLGNSSPKKRHETLLLNKSDASVEVEKNIQSALDKDDQQDAYKQPEKLSDTSKSTVVMTEIENECGTFADNGQSTKNDGKNAGKKGRGTQLKNLISLEKENLPYLGKPAKSSNNSGVGDNQGTFKSKNIVGKKRRGTLVLNKSEVLVETGNEKDPIIHDNEVRRENESLKSNLTVRKSNAISSDPSTIQSGLTTLRNEPACFLVSGHRLQRKEFHQFIKRLKGRHCRDSHQWSYQATHFIVPDPIRRTEKFFAAAASGRWILKTDYLTESIQAGKFLPEEPYEWHKNGLTQDGAINLEAPRKWRLQREKTGHGAFYGMRIVVYGECIAPPLDTLKRVVKAGDGIILATSPPYTRFLNSGVDFAIVSPGMPRVDMWVQEFLRHEIPCVSADYLVEYVCKPGYPLDRHVQYNTHEWAAKSFDRLSSLSIESVSDAATPENLVSDDLDLACQVCGCSDRADVMLVCGDESGSTGCGAGMHIDCCDPPFDDVPEEDWFCPKCIQSKTKPLSNTKKTSVVTGV